MQEAAMSMKPKFCSQCGAAVVTREVHDRQRMVCPTCELVFYENPLPIAACVLLNERREVLLVRRKREPHKGLWCLPMGFAELGETIAEAALRELKEEAGIDAHVLRLVDADSLDNSRYGELLIVTFELHKTGGQETPGDDADEVRYFPIGRHPPLAFSSNEKALRACAAAHMESWSIQDSFVTLQSDEDKAMLSDALIATLEQHAGEIGRGWAAEVCSNPTTASYHGLEVGELAERASFYISQFGRWLKGMEAEEEVRDLYRSIAQERKAQGYRLHELLSALMLLKKHVWNFARSCGVWERPIDVYRVLELNRLIAVFFDRAMYQAARGFEAALAPDVTGGGARGPHHS
jgi:8-oxo-dGTP diphosphatase